MSSKVIKLTWSEVAEMVRTELRKIIGRDVFCVAKSDDDTYWDISFPLERLPLSDLHRILEALDATDSQRDLSLPPEEDHADSVSSLSMTVSQLLLRRNLGYDWECLHLAEDSFWILGVKDAPETNDFIKIGSQRFPLGELKSRQEVLDYLRENGASHTALMDICEKYNLDYEVEEIFAAQNRNKTQPGVSILPQVEQTHGEKAVEAHILRRIFATIRIRDWETDELTTTLVVAYHQDGIQAAIGPCVKICHNQCILSPQRSISNYGKKKVTTDELFETVDGWLANFEVNMNEDIARIQRLKRRIVSLEEVYMYIGLLTALRVSHDSSDRNLSSSVETYPLNQSQISIFTEEVLKLIREKGQVTAWDLYNVATEIYKPGRTDFPALIPQNGAMAELLLSRLPSEVEIQDAVLVV